MNKIRILFYNKDIAGVNYFRTETPAIALEKYYSDKFEIEINSNIDFNDPNVINYLRTFNIINYHREFHPDPNVMLRLVKELEMFGVKFVVDIDDYWQLDKNHPLFGLAKEQKIAEKITDNLKVANYVTTTTDYFADEIKKITGKDNVGVFYNAIDPSFMGQFTDKRFSDPNGLVRIVYAGGSSHKHDVKLLEGVFNRLHVDPETKGKFKIIIAGWDTTGETTELSIDEEFGKEMQMRGLWTKQILKALNQTRGNIQFINGIPKDLKDKYKEGVYRMSKRPLRADESVYLQYENILTDNHRIISDRNYINYLNMYVRGTYQNEGNFARRWTEKANVYANVLNEADIVLAPLVDNEFNRMKSNLKQVECWTRKLPIICSDMVPYNVDGIDGVNCLLVPHKPNEAKHWFKALKKLILDADLRKELGQNLYDKFSVDYHLKNVSQKRADFYQKIINQ